MNVEQSLKTNLPVLYMYCVRKIIEKPLQRKPNKKLKIILEVLLITPYNISILLSKDKNVGA